MNTPKLIAFTLPYYIENEAEYLTALLRSEAFDRVHIRKPGESIDSLRKLIESIPADLRPRLSLHDFHSLASEFGCGINLNSRNPIKPIGFQGIVSRSCHSMEEIEKSKEEDYLFLSPVYPSISKPGYIPYFSLNDLKGKVNRRIIALGGVTPERLPELFEIGFGGAAMLGLIWEEVRKGNLTQLMNNLKNIKHNASIHNT